MSSRSILVGSGLLAIFIVSIRLKSRDQCPDICMRGNEITISEQTYFDSLRIAGYSEAKLQRNLFVALVDLATDCPSCILQLDQDVSEVRHLGNFNILVFVKGLANQDDELAFAETLSLASDEVNFPSGLEPIWHFHKLGAITIISRNGQVEDVRVGSQQNRP